MPENRPRTRSSENLLERENFMKIYSVFDPEFSEYGQVVSGYDTGELLSELIRCSEKPMDRTLYVQSDKRLEKLPVVRELSDHLFGGMPVEIGYCNGANTKLNCFEYHRDSEVNVSPDNFILLLAKRSEIQAGKIDTSVTKAFLVPTNTMVEVYATSLHYAPCSAKAGEGFRVLVVLPRGTNGEKPLLAFKNEEDRRLFACNKWLLAHADAPEVSSGAVVALTGANIDIKDSI